jgi:hypothetical protein
VIATAPGVLDLGVKAIVVVGGLAGIQDEFEAPDIKKVIVNR